MALDEREYDELPDGWVWTRLESIGEWSTGGTPSRKVPQYYNGGIRWIKSGDLNDRIVQATEETVSKDGIKNSAAKVLPIGTVSVALYGATIGKLGILGLNAATNQACASCFVNPSISMNWFLFFFLLAERKKLIEAGQGGAQPNINNRIVREWPVPLPPLAEQKRIVAKVDELLSRVNAARERLDRVPAILKRFRQSVLAAACSGRLTDDWREQHPDTEPASALLERIRTERRRQWEQAELAKMKAKGKKPKDGKWKAKYKEPEPVDATDLPELPDGWVTVPLNVACSMIGDGTHFSPINTPQGDFLYITAKNIRPWGVDLSNVTYVSKDVHKEIYSRCPAEKGDVLYIKDGATTGLAVVNHLEQEFSMLSSVALLKPERVALDAFFLKHWLNCPKTHKMMTGQMSGSAITRLVLKTIRAVEMPLPPLAEQQEIVRRVESLFALADEIESQVARGTRRVEKITQSVLAKAFRGELVPTEAELARQEGRDYEPASVLLERIKAQRKITKPKRERKSSKEE